MALTLACDLLAATTRGGGAQILDAAIGARADEDAIDRNVGDLLAALQPHIIQRTFRRFALVLVGDRRRGAARGR